MPTRTTSSCWICRTRISGAPGRRPCRSFPRPPERRAPSAKCFRSSRASSTASRCACRCRTSRSSTWRCSSTRRRRSDDVNGAFRDAASGPLKGILQYMTEPLVSIDFRGNAYSSILDADYTKVMDGDFVKILVVVRQRMGLLEPLRRSAGLHGQKRTVVVSRQSTVDSRQSSV